jgi:antitoxin ParD1/3/4
MPRLNVDLTPEMAEYVAERLAAGDYASESELFGEALRLLRGEREAEAKKAEILGAHLDIALGQAWRGEFSTKSVAEIAEIILREAAE